ncbi:MAG: MFS transporter [Rhodospirillaceae bacterium]|nr:MFS transporter [Rhodospirillaceae bacterium]
MSTASPSPGAHTPSEFKTGGTALFASFVGAACAVNGVPFYTHGVFVGPVSAEFGWGRGETQFAFSFVMLVATFTAPFIGGVIDRIGARAIAIPSVAAFALTFALLSLTGASILSYYALWLLMAVVGSGTIPVTWTRVVNGWFDKNRGLALGLTMAGTGVIGTFAPSVANALIADYGWRGAYVALGIAIAVVSLPILFLFFRDRPAPQAHEAQRSTQMVEGLTPREALRGYRFWVMGIAMFLICGGVAGLITNLVPLLTDKGMPRPEAAAFAGVIGLSVIAGRLVAGWLIDRFWGPGVAFVFLIAPAISCLVLAQAAIDPALLWIAVPLIGLAAGAELDMLAFFTAKYFGMKHYGALYGGQFGFFAISSGFAPALFGAVYDRVGNYEPILLIAAVCFVIGAALFLTLGRYPSFAGKVH